MKKHIGNIIVNSLQTKLDSCFNKCLSVSNADISLPILIIGLQNAKADIQGFNILKKTYNDGMLWWTFSKNERRVDYDKDVEDFKTFCINNVVDKIRYKNIDLINLDSFSKIRKLVLYIKSNRKKHYYIDSNKFVFLYDKNEVDNIYGLSLNTLAFFGIKKRKAIDLLRKNTNNVEIKNFYYIPNNIRRIINDDIPKEMILREYF